MSHPISRYMGFMSRFSSLWMGAPLAECSAPSPTHRRGRPIHSSPPPPPQSFAVCVSPRLDACNVACPSTHRRLPSTPPFPRGPMLALNRLEALLLLQHLEPAGCYEPPRRLDVLHHLCVRCGQHLPSTHTHAATRSRRHDRRTLTTTHGGHQPTRPDPVS